MVGKCDVNFACWSPHQQHVHENVSQQILLTFTAEVLGGDPRGLPEIEPEFGLLEDIFSFSHQICSKKKNN